MRAQFAKTSLMNVCLGTLNSVQVCMYVCAHSLLEILNSVDVVALCITVNATCSSGNDVYATALEHRTAKDTCDVCMHVLVLRQLAAKPGTLCMCVYACIY
jgi:hypothetical protein